MPCTLFGLGLAGSSEGYLTEMPDFTVASCLNAVLTSWSMMCCRVPRADAQG